MILSGGIGCPVTCHRTAIGIQAGTPLLLNLFSRKPYQGMCYVTLGIEFSF